MLEIVPCLWFADNNCDEAIHEYVKIFPNSKITQITYYPDEALNEHFKGMSGKVLTAEFELNNQKFIALDGGPTFRFNEAISFTIYCKNQEEIDTYWDQLSDDPQFEQCGWVKDRFGLSWQIVPENLNALTQNEAQIKALMSMTKINIQMLESLASD